MVSKSFYVNCIVRLVLICVSMGLFFGLFFSTRWYVMLALLGGVTGLQIASFLKYVSRTNYFLARTLAALSHDDFSERMASHHADAYFRELTQELNRIIERFQAMRLENQRQFLYLKAVVEQSGVGLVSLQPDGRINLSNKAVRRLLGISHLSHIRQVRAINEPLADTLATLASGHKAHVPHNRAEHTETLLLYAQDLRMRGESFKLISMSNIQGELEFTEMEAWKHLTRVLSHEIMNSLTPIASLGATAEALLQGEVPLSASRTEKVKRSIRIIVERSHGLMEFVENYRRLMRVPAPNLKSIAAGDLLQRLTNLLGARLDSQGVRLSSRVEPSALMLRIDPDLMEQVLLNLMQNALEALAETPEPLIRLHAGMDESAGSFIQVIDNGPGIEAGLLPKLFIPFFTTKKQGSGIGLSLCRQIMQLHGGAIRIRSTPGRETIVTLYF